jgi:parallel beta-helix repeat protein
LAGIKQVIAAGAFAAVPLVPGLPVPEPSGHRLPPNGSPAMAARSQPAPSARARRICSRFAAPWGSNRARGTARSPFRTPKRLVRALRSGRTGCLRAGTYRQREVKLKRDGIALRSSPGERATIRGRVVLEGNRDGLYHLSLDGSAGPRCPEQNCGTLPSPTINGSDARVVGNDITSPGSGICVATKAWDGHVPNRFRVVGNRVHNCGRLPPTEHDHGIYIADARGGLIRDNVVFDNADRGIQLFPNARDTLVEHNTVDGNGSGIVFSVKSSRNVVRANVFSNSIVRWNAETFQLTGLGNQFVRNCVRPGNPNSAYDQDGGVALPPIVKVAHVRPTNDGIYVDRSKRDFRIAWGSACAGEGAPASVARPPGR